LARISPEIRPFLYRLLGDVVLADEAHSATCERLWRGLANFRWQCSLRSWSYIIARREADRCRARHLRVAAAQTTLSAANEVPANGDRRQVAYPPRNRTRWKMFAGRCPTRIAIFSSCASNEV
jgi:DNA-directed RNA polymerase specialized sigma24 family protein